MWWEETDNITSVNILQLVLYKFSMILAVYFQSLFIESKILPTCKFHNIVFLISNFPSIKCENIFCKFHTLGTYINILLLVFVKLITK